MQDAKILFAEYANQFSSRIYVCHKMKNRFGYFWKIKKFLMKAPNNSKESRVNFNDGRFGRLSKNRIFVDDVRGFALKLSKRRFQSRA